MYSVGLAGEDSQINFAMGNVFCMLIKGWVLHKNIAQIFAIINFSSREIA